MRTEVVVAVTMRQRTSIPVFRVTVSGHVAAGVALGAGVESLVLAWAGVGAGTSAGLLAAPGWLVTAESNRLN